MPNNQIEPILTERFALALSFANAIHNKQVRKGYEESPGVPYISHLMTVSSSVLEFGGSETEAIAALLHDSAEDCGGRPMLEVVRAMFGDEVAEIVEGCTDTFESPKPDWNQRKQVYVDHLKHASRSIKLVAGCDKLHNLNTTIRDLRSKPPKGYWDKFNAGPEQQSWYYASCRDALQGSPVVDEFERSFQEFGVILRERKEIDHGAS